MNDYFYPLEHLVRQGFAELTDFLGIPEIPTTVSLWLNDIANEENQ